MNLGLDGKAVVVTGASRGIGRAIAQTFLREGARVTLVARGAKDLESAARDMRREFGDDRVTSATTDATTSDGVRAAIDSTIDAFGSIDVVVANVGRGSYPAGYDRPMDEWREVLTLNLVSGMELVRQCVPVLQRKSDGGSIVFVSSIAGVEDVGASIPYSVAKAGLIAATKALARTLAPTIRVNAVAPGNVLFPGGSWERRRSERREEVETMLRTQVALRRFGTPDEIAAAVVFLASDRASFTTGACLIVDGGQTRSW